jgi:SAM-dependent methyltransferase
MPRCEEEKSTQPSDPLSDSQCHSLQSMSLKEIPHGASVEAEWLKADLPERAEVAEFGSGQPGKSKILSQNFSVTAFDINPEAIRAANELGIQAYLADVTDPHEIGHTIQKEKYDAVVMEGLLCNLMGQIKFQKVLYNAASALKPDGHLYVADVLAAEVSGPNTFFRNALGEQGCAEYWGKWITRYTNNLMAFDLPEYHFVVFSMGEGPEKDAEWGWPGTLRQNVNRKERYARHIPEYDLKFGLELAGFSECRYEYVVWRSRTGAPLIGFKGDWQKQTRKPLQTQEGSV